MSRSDLLSFQPPHRSEKSCQCRTLEPCIREGFLLHVLLNCPISAPSRIPYAIQAQHMNVRTHFPFKNPHTRLNPHLICQFVGCSDEGPIRPLEKARLGHNCVVRMASIVSYQTRRHQTDVLIQLHRILADSSRITSHARQKFQTWWLKCSVCIASVQPCSRY